MEHTESSVQGQAIHNSDLTYQVLRVVRVRAVRRRNGECSLEEIFKECATYPQDKVLAEIDRLSRTGGLRVVYKEGGEYAVSLPKAA